MNKGHISILLPDLRVGGAERVAVNLANEFVCRGYEVDMVLLSVNGPLLSELSCKVRVVDLKAERIRQALVPLCRYLRQKRPLALLANMWPLPIVALWARMLTRVSTRVVVAEHTTWSRDEITSTRWGRWLVGGSMHFVYPGADGIVAVSNGAADDLACFAKLDRKTITVIYNPIVGSQKTPVTKSHAPIEWWTGGHRKVLAVGTLKGIKDYSTLLTAFAKLRQSVPARLLILGEGEYRSALQVQTRLLGIEASVFMPGFVADPSPFYLQAELHVLSSTGEGFGNVIVEALAAGTPVVSTDCPSGPREILCNGQFGRLVPVGDSVALAAAMADSLVSDHDHEALKARAKDFSIDKAVVQYEAVLIPKERFL